MSPIQPLVAAYERARWMRPDAHRFLRSDWRRFVRLGSELAALYDEIERKYRPDQPRVPAGVSEGGRWTDGSTELSAQRRRAPGPGDATPAQAARLAIAEGRARDALSRVRQYDPSWRPTPSLTGTVEGRISAAEAEAREAQARLSELARVGIGPGPYSGDSIPARGSGWDFTTEERGQINEIGARSGCHTCGTQEPGTKSGNFIPDHQPPSVPNYRNAPQRLYPQCLTCSLRQGGVAKGLKE